MATSWEDGIIAKLETFAMSRMPIDIKFARGGAACVVSIALSKAVLEDKLGPVRPNIFIIHVDASGSYKTPFMRMIKRIIRKFNIKYMAPTTMTTQGMTAWIEGGNPVSEEPHPANFIIKDEASKWTSDLKQDVRAGLLEYLSQLWDCEIEGYVTRSYGNEGNLEPYTVIFAATTGTFFNYLKKEFFQSGTGNRPLWSVGDFDESKIKMAGPDFFMGLDERDYEWDALSDEIVGKLKQLEKIEYVVVGDMSNEWKKWRYDVEVQATKVGGGEGEYLRKQPLNALKLAIIYAGSRMSIDHDRENVLFVMDEDIHRAIEDISGYIQGWKSAMRVWAAQCETAPEPIVVVTDLMTRLLEIASKNGNVLTLKMASAALDIAFYPTLGRGITLGVNKEYLEGVNEMGGTRGTATDDELRRTHTKGPIPQIWRLTKSGREFLGV